MNMKINANVVILALSGIILLSKTWFFNAVFIDFLACSLFVMLVVKITFTMILTKKETYTFKLGSSIFNFNGIPDVVKMNKEGVVDDFMHNLYQIVFAVIMFNSLEWNVIPAMMLVSSSYCIVKGLKNLKFLKNANI